MWFGALAAAFLAQFATATIVQTNVCQPLSQPVITIPANGVQTSQSQITVGGTADPNSPVAILDNNQAQAQINSDASGNFGVTVNLAAGQNQLVARASNACQNSDSVAVGVTYNAPQPQPGTMATAPVSAGQPASQVQSPSASLPAVASAPARPGTLTLQLSAGVAATSLPSFWLSGRTSLPATITVEENGKQVAQLPTDQAGNFKVRLPLMKGLNTLTVTASRPGQTASSQLEITRHAVPAEAMPKQSVIVPAGAAVATVALGAFLWHTAPPWLAARRRHP